MIYIFLCLLSTNPQPDIIPRSYCERIECNYYYSEDSRGKLKLTFKQLLLEDWDLNNPRNKDGWACRQFIIIQEPPALQRNARGLYEYFHKKEDDICIVESPQYIITHTTYDREMENRRWWGEGSQHQIFRTTGITPAARKAWRYHWEGWIKDYDGEPITWPLDILQ